MRILTACECSARVRDAFRARGHDVWSCDLKPCESDQRYHLQCDVREILNDNWDMIIAFPDCTYLCSSGLHWNKNSTERAALTEEAITFVRLLLNAPIRHKAIENPVGRISTAIRPATQYIQPYQFGEDASKKTGLWLENLPPLRPTKFVEPRIVEYKGKMFKRWSNQTDSGQNRLGPSEQRATERARTYLGIARAMAEQWGQSGIWRE